MSAAKRLGQPVSAPPSTAAPSLSPPVGVGSSTLDYGGPPPPPPPAPPPSFPPPDFGTPPRGTGLVDGGLKADFGLPTVGPRDSGLIEPLPAAGSRERSPFDIGKSFTTPAAAEPEPPPVMESVAERGSPSAIGSGYGPAPLPGHLGGPPIAVEIRPNPPSGDLASPDFSPLLGAPPPAPPPGSSSKVKLAIGALLSVGLVTLLCLGHGSKASDSSLTDSPTPAENWSGGEGLIENARKNLKLKNFKAASQDASDAYRIVQACQGVPPAKLDEILALRKSANLGMADVHLKEAEKALRRKNWGAAGEEAEQARTLYVEYNGDAKKNERSRFISQVAHKKVRASQGH